MSHLLLTETNAGVSKADIFTVILVRRIKIGFPLYIIFLPAFKFSLKIIAHNGRNMHWYERFSA